MSDVSAVVLTLGESTTPRALVSLAAQTYPVHDVIVVENVSPFSHAFNEGAVQVSTPFFIQVDADMVLDATCVEELRASIGHNAGLAYGELRDRLMGQVVGIKLFRTECVRRHPYRDSISPDTDFNEAIQRAGWDVVYLGLPPSGSAARPRTFGDHEPDYAPAYTFAKYLLEGRRYRYRGNAHGLFWQIERLEASSHPLARFVQIALSHGFFLTTERDELRPSIEDPRARWLTELLASDGRYDEAMEGLPSLSNDGRLRAVFRGFFRAGQALGVARAGATLRDILASLSGAGRAWPTLVAKLAIGHGVLRTAVDSVSLANDEQALKSFVLLGLGRRVAPLERLQARAVAAARRFRPDPSPVRW